jgi:hypothetical protein
MRTRGLAVGLAVIGIGAIVALCFALPRAQAAAPVPSVITPSGKVASGPYASWIRRAKAPGLSGKLAVATTGCPHQPSIIACVRTNRPRTIWLRPEYARIKRLFMHELGHVFDLNVMSHRERKDFRRIHRLGDRRWFKGFQPAGEWFADAYALCAQTSSIRTRPFATAYGYSPTPARHRATCRLIARASSDRDRPQRPPTTPPVVVDPVVPAPAPTPPGRVRCLLIFTCPAPSTS